jgi:hypothetical protein
MHSPEMAAVFEQRASEVLDEHLRFLYPLVSTIRNKANRERRAKPRLTDSLPARVWGTDSEGEMISLDCQVDNLSASGLFLRMPCQIKLRSQISLVVRLLNGSGSMAAIKGKVVRDEPHLDGSRGIAVRITQHRFL